jgi:hypothetical protein
MLLLHSRVVGTVFGAPKKLINWPRPLFRPKTDHACPQKPNPSSETVPLTLGAVPALQASMHIYHTVLIVFLVLLRRSFFQCCGSGMFIPDPGSDFFPCRIRPVSIPDPGSSSKNFSILTPKKWFLSS